MDSFAPNTLIIDDDYLDAQIVSRTLCAIEGWEGNVRHVVSSEKAHDAIEPKEIDIIFLDYLLGANTGVESIPQLRAAGFKAPIVILTSQGDTRVAVSAIQAGAADYLSKNDVNPDSLERTIVNSLEKWQLGQALEKSRSELERSNRNLVDKCAEIQNFYHVLAHELRTPLTSANEFISILLDPEFGEMNPDQRRFLSIVGASCSQIGVCIEDLLDVTRLETGKLSIAQEPVEIGDLLEKITTSFRARARTKKIILESSVEPNLNQRMFADATRVQQILNNLIGNALKFTPKSGEIRVNAKTDIHRPGMVLFSVTDNGRGIENKLSKRVFDRLFQVCEEDAANESGLGLGLTLCKELVELHGGTIWVDSQPGLGSTFCFTLPIYDELV